MLRNEARRMAGLLLHAVGLLSWPIGILPLNQAQGAGGLLGSTRNNAIFLVQPDRDQ
jgi:hypothetical protein